MRKEYGVVTGVVQSVEDPDRAGRIKLRFPWLPGEPQSFWAPVATLMSGRGRGAWFMPEKDDEVLVAFQHGDLHHPVVLGFLWNGEQRPPSDDHQLRVFRSVNGHEIAVYDPGISEGDTGYIRLQDAHGNLVELANGRVTISSVGSIEMVAPNVVINGRPVAQSPSAI